MFYPPKTVEEAKAYQYGSYEDAIYYDPELCAYEVYDKKQRWHPFQQCSRPNGHGVRGLYCKQHAKMVKG